MTVFRPQEDKDYTSRSEMFERIVSALSGRTAESLFLGDISTGSSGDINSASQIARAMVTRYGMSEKVGPISFDDSSRSVFIGRDFSQTKSYSEKTAATIDDEVKLIFDAALKKSEEILTKNKKLLVALVEYLNEHETMDGEDFKYFCENKGKAPPKKPKPEPVASRQDGAMPQGVTSQPEGAMPQREGVTPQQEGATPLPRQEEPADGQEAQGKSGKSDKR
jgi:cell division protease FtsH